MLLAIVEAGGGEGGPRANPYQLEWASKAEQLDRGQHLRDGGSSGQERAAPRASGSSLVPFRTVPCQPGRARQGPGGLVCLTLGLHQNPVRQVLPSSLGSWIVEFNMCVGCQWSRSQNKQLKVKISGSGTWLLTQQAMLPPTREWSNEGQARTLGPRALLPPRAHLPWFTHWNSRHPVKLSSTSRSGGLRNPQHSC